MNFEEWNDEMQTLVQRWERWMNKPYPSGWGGVNIAGCELVLVDADIAMLIKAAVEKGPLRRQSAEELSRLLESLHRALPFISGSAAEYFGELAEIAGAAVRLAAAVNAS